MLKYEKYMQLLDLCAVMLFFSIGLMGGSAMQKLFADYSWEMFYRAAIIFIVVGLGLWLAVRKRLVFRWENESAEDQA